MANKETVKTRSDTQNIAGQMTQTTRTPGISTRTSIQLPSTETSTDTQPAYTTTRQETTTTPAVTSTRTTTAQAVTVETVSSRPESTTSITETKKSHLSIKFSMTIPIHNREPVGNS